MLERARKRPQKIKGGLEFVSFIRAGEQNRVGEVEGGRLFGIVSDWQLNLSSIKFLGLVK